jgi:histidyl-tRNA synthetase
MDYAASAKVRIVVIVGPRELKEGNVRLRDMKTGEERNVPKNRVVVEIAKILA